MYHGKAIAKKIITPQKVSLQRINLIFCEKMRKTTTIEIGIIKPSGPFAKTANALKIKNNIIYLNIKPIYKNEIFLIHLYKNVL